MKKTGGSGFVCTAVLVAASLVAVTACKQDEAAPSGPAAPVAGSNAGSPGGGTNAGSPGVTSDVAVPPRITSPVIGELLAAVPATATALGFMDLNEAPWSYATRGVLLPLDQATRTTLDKELRAHFDRYLGLDVSRLQYAVGFVSGPPARAALVLSAVAGTPKMPGAIEHEGGKLWVVDADARLSLAHKGEIVVFGKDDAVREVLETLAGKHKPVTTANPALVDWLRTQGAGAVFALAAVVPQGLPLPPQIAGLQRVSLTLGTGGIHAVVDGDDAAISRLQTMSDQAFAAALAQVETQHQAALAGTIPPAEGAMAILGAAYANSFATRLKPQRAGNRLSAGLELGTTDATMVVAGVGVLAAVAIPAFMSYMKKSKDRAHGQQVAEPPL